MFAPDFVLIGAAKSGTSALFEMICNHPRIFRPPLKEPMFFALGDRPPRFEPEATNVTMRRRTVWERQDYEALFEGAGDRLTGEASTMYLSSVAAAERLGAEAPGAKLLAILRDPVERAHSAFTHLRRDGQEPLSDFADALAVEPQRIELGYPPLWHYRRGGCYARDLEPWIERFGREQLLLLRYEQLRERPQELALQVWHFLGLHPADARRPPRLNAGGEVRSARVRRLLVGENAAKTQLRRLLGARSRNLIWRRLMAANVRPVERALDPGLERELRAFYGPEIDRLERISGWDLTTWR